MKRIAKALHSCVFALTLVASALALFVVPTAAISGGAFCSVADPVWRAGHDRTQSALRTAVDQMSATVARENETTASQIVSVIRVLTSQRSHTDGQIAVADRKATEAGTSAITANMTRMAIVRAEETYGTMGQAPDACEVAERLALLSETMSGQQAVARDLLTSPNIDARAGGVVDLDDSMRRRLATASPQTVNVALSLLDPNASEETVAGFINNLTGLPLRKVEIDEGGVSAGSGNIEDYHQNLLAQRVEALRSPALYSLGTIRGSFDDADHSGLGGPHGGTLDDQLQWLVARYGGGDDHLEWSAELATKSEVGIVKEIARLRSIQMAVSRMNSDADGRITTMFATLIAQEADGD